MVAGGYWNDIVGTNLTKDDKENIGFTIKSLMVLL